MIVKPDEHHQGAGLACKIAFAAEEASLFGDAGTRGDIETAMRYRVSAS